MNRDPFATGGIYHLYNRGNDKRDIFLDNADRHRFCANLLEFNDLTPALNQYYKSLYEVQPRKKVVEILAYCLMTNHYHLLVRQIVDGGTTLFMRKLGTGYTMYFNKKYERSGSLFQGKFKSVEVTNDAQLRYIPHYIHLNPLELTLPNWQSGDFNQVSALTALDRFQWSSYHAYKGIVHSTIVDTQGLLELYPNGYLKDLEDWINPDNIRAMHVF